MQNIEVNLSKEVFFQRAPDLLGNMLIIKDLKKRFELYTGYMEQARELGVEKEAAETAEYIAKSNNEAEFWELPKPFVSNTVQSQKFPFSCLPPVLADYLKAVADYVQVYPEMCVLPMFSVLSLCLQGKAVVKYPGNNHTEPLNLYTMTVAAPGERKSGTFKAFMKPVEDFQERYNALHKVEIEQFQTEKAFLERQKQSAISGKNASLEKAKEITSQLLALEEKHELRLNINDCTPEALAWEMHLQGERIGIIDDEGTVFDVLSGLYSGGVSNINIFLKSYDGAPYTISRRTQEDIFLSNPLLTIGLMTQPKHFSEAVNNKQFMGRGFIHRFLFCFPASKTGFQDFKTPDIPSETEKKYVSLIESLLNMAYPKMLPVVSFDAEACRSLSGYHDHLQSGMQEGGHLFSLKEWASKQFARCLKITALLHLCEHGVSEPITALEAEKGAVIASWFENQAEQAIGELSESPLQQNALYLLGKIEKISSSSVSKSEVLRRCSKFTASELEEPLQLLEDMNYIKIESIKQDKGRPREQIFINPILKK